MKQLKVFFFGKTVKGERVRKPMFRTTYPTEYLTKNEWMARFRVASQCRRVVS